MVNVAFAVRLDTDPLPTMLCAPPRTSLTVSADGEALASATPGPDVYMTPVVETPAAVCAVGVVGADPAAAEVLIGDVVAPPGPPKAAAVNVTVSVAANPVTTIVFVGNDSSG